MQRAKWDWRGGSRLQDILGELLVTSGYFSIPFSPHAQNPIGTGGREGKGRVIGCRTLIGFEGGVSQLVCSLHAANLGKWLGCRNVL